MNPISEVYGAAIRANTEKSLRGKGTQNEDFATLFAAGIDASAGATGTDRTGKAESSANGSEVQPEDDGLEAAAAEGQNETASAGTTKNDASDALNKAIEEALINSAINITGSSDMSAYTSGGGLESLALAAAAGGEMDQTQIAMLMLMMMINMAGESSDTSMLFSAMSALMSTMTSDTGSSETERTVNSQVLGWDSVERQTSSSTPSTSYTGAVKSAAQPSVSSSGAVIPTNAWVATTPAVVNTEGNRSPAALREVLDQFNVETSTRYTPYRNGNTYCNIFVWDATNALGCEVPHYVDYATGEPRYYPDVSGAYELDANGVHDWLVNKGAEYGWREVTAEEAQAWANKGNPVVAARKKSGGIGHVQMVCPSKDGSYDPVNGPTVTQAGSKNSNYTYQSNIYGSESQKQVRYFVHA